MRSTKKGDRLNHGRGHGAYDGKLEGLKEVDVFGTDTVYSGVRSCQTYSAVPTLAMKV